MVAVNDDEFPSPWADISEHFEVVHESVVYVDSPIEGLLRSRTGDTYAFRCFTIAEGRLWHWTLLPCEPGDNPAQVFRSAAAFPPERWTSILEDRRIRPTLTGATLVTRDCPIPVSALDHASHAALRSP